MNSYTLPLSYRSSLYTYNSQLAPFGYLGYGYGGYNEAYLNNLRNVNNPYLPLNYRPLEYDLAKRYNQNGLLKNKYSYYQPELYKTSYNYTNPYSLVNPLAHPILTDALLKSDPKLIVEPKHNPNLKTSLPSIPTKNTNLTGSKQAKKKLSMFSFIF